MQARKLARNLLAHVMEQNIWREAMVIIRTLLRDPILKITFSTNIGKKLAKNLLARFMAQKIWRGAMVIIWALLRDPIMKTTLKMIRNMLKTPVLLQGYVYVLHVALSKGAVILTANTELKDWKTTNM